MRAMRAAGRRACVCTGLKWVNFHTDSHRGLSMAVRGSGRRSSSVVYAGAICGSSISSSGSGWMASQPSQRSEMART